MSVRTKTVSAPAGFVSIKKVDDEQHLIYGEVYAPNVPDSQGDFMQAAEIQKMAHDFLRKGRTAKVDTNHDNKVNGSAVVESFIARDGDETFIPGSWVVGIHVPDDTLWGMVKSGDINGFSFEGRAYRTKREIELEVPPILEGLTSEVAGHVHKFEAEFDDAGRFLGGRTDEVDGHMHMIRAGTVTETAAGHTHRFSVIEGFRHA